jgi:hypothetical protein
MDVKRLKSGSQYCIITIMKFGKWCMLLLLFLLVTPYAKEALKLNAVVGSTSVTLSPIADSYVNSTDSNANYGSRNSLIVYTDSHECYSYIMFNLSGIPSNAVILSAELEVRLARISGYECNVGVHMCSDSTWTESGITWSNMPEFTSEPTDIVKFRGLVVWSGYKYWNVTVDAQAMLGTGRLTEVLVLDWSDAYTYANFDSRETGDRPFLHIEYAIAPLYLVHLESVQDTGETANVGRICIVSDYVVYPLKSMSYTEKLPQDVTIMGGSYNVTYNSGLKFVKWETSGGVKVADESAQSTTITVFGQGTLRVVGNSRRIEYLYDDGSCEADVGSAKDPGEIAAVRFTPVVANRLLSARLYFYKCQDDTIRIHVMDAERRDLIAPFDQTPKFEQIGITWNYTPVYATFGWLDVDLSDYNLTVSAGTDFYIGMEWVAGGNPKLGVDWSRYNTYDPIDDRSLVWNGTDWTIIQRVDYMIRAVVGVPRTSTSITCSVYPRSIEIGSEVRVSGFTNPSRAGAEISLNYTRQDNSTVSRTVIVGTDGSYDDAYAPDKVGKWSVEAKLEGNEDYEGATSQPVLFVVKLIPSSISCSLSSTTIQIGSTVKISGSIQPSSPYVVYVYIFYSMDDGITWEMPLSIATVEDRKYSYTWKPPAVGTYKVKAEWFGDEKYDRAESPIQTIVVTSGSTTQTSTTTSKTTTTSSSTSTSTSTPTPTPTTIKTTTQTSSTSTQTTQPPSTSAQPAEVNLVLFMLPFIVALVVVIVVIVILLIVFMRRAKGR